MGDNGGEQAILHHNHMGPHLDDGELMHLWPKNDCHVLTRPWASEHTAMKYETVKEKDFMAAAE